MVVDKSIFYNEALSLAAKGLMAILCCVEDDHGDVDEEALATASGLSLMEVETLLQELEVQGFLCRDEEAMRLADEQAQQQRAEFDSTHRPTVLTVHPESVVYYLRRADGAVKIGFTQHLDRRMRVLTRQFGPLELLAGEPGGWHKEQERHREFAAARIRPDEEWFTQSSKLRKHIRSLTKMRETTPLTTG